MIYSCLDFQKAFDSVDENLINTVDHENVTPMGCTEILCGVEFYLYPTVGTVLIHSAKPELTE